MSKAKRHGRQGILLIFLLTLCALFSSAAAAGERSVKLGSDEWCPFICSSDGQHIDRGYLIELARLALAGKGYDVDGLLMPLTRAMKLSESGDIDGVFAPPIPTSLAATVTVGLSLACFYTAPDSKWTYHGLDSILQVSFGVIADYGYDNGVMDAYLARPESERPEVQFNFGQTAGIQNVRRVLAGRYEAMLEHRAVVPYLLSKLGGNAQLREAGCLETPFPLIIGFSRAHGKGDALAKAFDEGVTDLDKSGALARLQQGYGLSEP